MVRALNSVGRVGGLAVALGVGAAAFNYSAVAWADSPSRASEAPSAASETTASENAASVTAGAGATAPNRRTRGAAGPNAVVNRGGAGPAIRRPGAGSAQPRGSVQPRVTIPTVAGPGPAEPPPTAPIDTSDVISVASPAAAVAEQSVPDIPPAAVTAAALPVAPVPAPQPAPVSAFVTAAADPAADPFADGIPAVPIGSPLEWSVLAVARREGATAGTAMAGAAVQPAAATQPVILGPSGVPIPSSNYVDTVMDFYIIPNSPDGAEAPQVVFTPEGLYPITGVKSLPLDTSVAQGMTILSDTLALLPDGTTTSVFGYSQSSIISSLLQAGFVPHPPATPDGPPTIPAGLQDSIEFVLVANEMNPNGGFLSRFPDLNLPSLGIPFYGAIPDDAYPTVSYAREYDGFADFPRYPLNFLSVLNAGLGIVFVHTEYVPAPDCRGSFCLTKQEVEDAIALPTTSPTQQYYFMPTENLPLLEPLRLIPLIGNPIADLIQPVLKVIVDLGYGDPAHGFATGTQPDANVLVPFGLFPEVSPLEVLEKLVAGVGQGISDFIADFGPDGSIAREIASISLPPLSFALPTPDSLIAAVQDVVTAVAERISAAAAAVYAALLPTADIINAIVTVLPAYNITLFLDGISQVLNGDLIGGLVNAIGLPLAANVGLITTAGLVGVLAWAQAAVAVLDPNATIGT